MYHIVIFIFIIIIKKIKKKNDKNIVKNELD